MIKIQALKDVLQDNTIEENTLSLIFQNFRCKRDEDIEVFLSRFAIEYENKNISRTYFVMDDCVPGVIIGYFTIGLNVMHFDSSLDVEDAYEGINLYESGFRPVYKLFMIGKDDNYGNLVSMKDIFFSDALKYIKEAKDKVGGEILYIDCEPELESYYLKLGFEKLDSVQETSLIRMLMKI